MIQTLIHRLFPKRGPKPAKTSEPYRVIPAATHGISPDAINPCALKTVAALQAAGYNAFLVGGAVRDLLLGRRPKDFDVATDATPEEGRALFRRSRVIGRRFRLLHVLCGQETIEVSTFRGANTGEDARDASRSESGRILRDNVFGTQLEDARRRDFSINAFYYNPATQEVWDYHDGFTDLKARRLRMIGDPADRFREDPVRMLRAVRFAAKLDFHIDEATRAPVAQLAPLLKEVPQARLFDEMLKLLLSGHALRGVHQLRAEGLHHGLLPMLDLILERPAGERFVTAALKNCDERIAAGKPVAPGFLFAALYWHQVEVGWREREARGLGTYPALFESVEAALGSQELAVTRRFETYMREIWALQPRFLQRGGARPFRLLEHPRFRAAYDFFLLRADSGEVEAEVAEWWTRFQEAGDAARHAMLVAEKDGTGKKRRRRRRRAPTEGPAVEGQAAAPEAPEHETAP